MKKSLKISLAMILAVLLTIPCFVFPATAAEDAVISASSVTARAGQTVDVDIMVSFNPGIAGLTLDVSFDSDILTLISVTDGGIFGTNTHKPELRSPYTLSWSNDTVTENIVSNGVIATLRFSISEDAEAGDYPIILAYDYENYDAYNVDIMPVLFKLESGNVKVGAETPTEKPTTPPTEKPTAPPTEKPTTPPTEKPTASPTEKPTAPPTEKPTVPPTEKETDDVSENAELVVNGQTYKAAVGSEIEFVSYMNILPAYISTDKEKGKIQNIDCEVYYDTSKLKLLSDMDDIESSFPQFTYNDAVAFDDSGVIRIDATRLSGYMFDDFNDILMSLRFKALTVGKSEIVMMINDMTVEGKNGDPNYVFDDGVFLRQDITDIKGIVRCIILNAQPEKNLILLGDADVDGEVTIIDATIIQRHLAGLSTSSYCEKESDADEDAEVTILDATAIQRHLAGLGSNPHIGTRILK